MILVTGGMGFLGMHVARQLASEDELLLSYHHSRRDPSDVHRFVGRPVVTEQLDVGDRHSTARLFATYDIESVVHLAVPALGALSPAEEITVNVAGLVNILEASRLSGVRRVTIASSTRVYGGLDRGPYHEDVGVPVQSDGATGTMKKALEAFASHYASTTGLDVVILRIATVYGPLYHSFRNLPSKLAHHAVKNRPLGDIERAWSPEQLAAGFDLCYAPDCARASALVHRAKSTQHTIYNIGSGAVAHVCDVLDAVNECAQSAVTLPTRLPHIRPDGTDRYMDISRLAEEFDFAPEFTLKGGVRDYVDWLHGHTV